MYHRPGALTGFVFVILAATGSSSVGAWQSPGASPGFRQADSPGFRLDDSQHGDGGYPRSLQFAEQYKDYSFRPLREDEQAPSLAQRYRWQSRLPIHRQASARPAEFNGASGVRGHNGDPMMPDRSYSVPFRPRWEGSPPVLRPHKHAERQDGRPAYREITATRYRDSGLVFRPDQADFESVEPRPATPGVREAGTVPSRNWRRSSSRPPVHNNHRMWQFPRRR